MHKLLIPISKTLNKGKIPLRFDISKMGIHLKNFRGKDNFILFTFYNKI